MAGSVFVLDAKASGALTVSGSAQLKVSGNLIVDSSSSSALIDHRDRLGDGRRHPGHRGLPEGEQHDDQPGAGHGGDRGARPAGPGFRGHHI